MFVVEDASLLQYRSVFWVMRAYAQSGARGAVVGGVARGDASAAEVRELVKRRMRALVGRRA